MKQTTLLISAGLLLACGVGKANQVQIENVSEDSQLLTLVYQIARQNPGQAVQLEAAQTLTLTGAHTVPLNLDNYNLVGIMVTSINGRVLPSQVVRFGYGCSVVTGKTQLEGTLKISYLALPNDHGEIYCEHSGGVTLK